MTNHPNRPASTRVKWRQETFGSLTAIWPDGTAWTFSRPGGGYVYCDMGSARRSGTLGRQICYGGNLLGSTVHATTQSEFEHAVKKWLADYRRYERRNAQKL